MDRYGKQKLNRWKPTPGLILIFLLTIVLFPPRNVSAITSTFFDDFENATFTAANWGNERGSWYISNGVYGAQFPQNTPPTYSSVKNYTNLTDFTVSVDVKKGGDGGIWLRSSFDNPSSGGVGSKGIAFIIRPVEGDFYWHVPTSDGGLYPELQKVTGYRSLFGTDFHIDVVASGKVLTAYLNGTLLTTLDDRTGTYNIPASGSVGLYDFDERRAVDGGYQQYDNFRLTPTPIPGTLVLFGSGVLGLAGIARRRMKK